MHTQKHLHTHSHTHAYVRARTHTHTHTCTHITHSHVHAQVKQLVEGPDAPALLLIINPQWDERGGYAAEQCLQFHACHSFPQIIWGVVFT